MCRKRHSTSSLYPHQDSSASKLNEPRLFYDGSNIHSPTNTALILENIKQEVGGIDFEGTPDKMESASKRRSLADKRGILDPDVGVNSIHQFRSQSLKACKIEDDLLVDSGETTFSLFASLLDSALQGM